MSETIVLGGGCFWCLEPVFAGLRGVESAVVGYAGGTAPNPSYHQVCTGLTGHAEVVAVTFDPQIISLRALLDVFFSVHDPTTLNRQGADIGTQYRSVILYAGEAQRQAAEEAVAALNAGGAYRDPVVTQVAPLAAFYRAEEYHQQYFEKNPYAGYCQIVIHPKVEKFRQHHAGLLRPEA